MILRNAKDTPAVKTLQNGARFIQGVVQTQPKLGCRRKALLDSGWHCLSGCRVSNSRAASVPATSARRLSPLGRGEVVGGRHPVVKLTTAKPWGNRCVHGCLPELYAAVMTALAPG